KRTPPIASPVSKPPLSEFQTSNWLRMAGSELKRHIVVDVMYSGVLMGRSKLLLLALGLSVGLTASAQTPAGDCSVAGNPQCAAPQTRSGSQLSGPEKSSLNAPKVIYSNGQ